MERYHQSCKLIEQARMNKNSYRFILWSATTLNKTPTTITMITMIIKIIKILMRTRTGTILMIKMTRRMKKIRMITIILRKNKRRKMMVLGRGRVSQRSQPTYLSMVVQTNQKASETLVHLTSLLG